MELEDVDSLLATAISSDDDDDDYTSSIHRRTVDEILKFSSSSSTSSSSRSSSPVTSRPAAKSSAEPSPSPTRSNRETLEEEEKVEGGDIAPSSVSRRTSRELSVASSLPPLGLRWQSIPPRTLPPLFGGVRPSPKPGAALAAATAASRLVPTPHAAAIKSQRAVSAGNLDRDPRFSLESEVVGVEDGGGFEWTSSLVVAGGGLVVESSHLSSEEDGVGGGELVSSPLGDGGLVEKEVEGTEECVNAEEEAVLDFDPAAVSGLEIGKVEVLHLDNGNSNSSVPDEDNAPSQTPSSSPCPPASETLEQSGVHSPPPQSPSSPPHPPASETVEHSKSHRLKGNTEESLKLAEMQIDDSDKGTSRDGEAGVLREETNTKRNSIEQPNQRKGQLVSSERASKKAEKKLRASMKPLEWAEEIEKRQASSGLHWEEGAVSQPMRLEDIRKDPPAVGYLQIYPDNVISRAISSPAFQRDHGSPQVLATHVNFIAIGMSKGIVLVMPSKYSPHSADSMDSKLLMLGSEGEKSSSPVTSMCFNQQGDLLLVGYGDGHLTIWDMQKATAAKVITGEHTAPVVHTSFLGQDSQVTRQFKAVTGDSKGLVLLHAISVVPLLYRFSVKTQCLLDGKKTGTVLSVSPLLMDSFYLGGLTSAQGNSPVLPGGLGSMVGGVVGGVVGGEAGRKFFNEGSLAVEEGVVVFVTHQNALVVRLTPSLEVYKNLSKPEGVREGSVPYTAWKCAPFARGSSKEHAAAIASDSTSWLVIAWDRKVLVYKLVKSELINHREWSIDSEAIGVAWLDDQMLVVLTWRRNLCCFSRDGVDLHRTSFVLDGTGGDDFMSYHTHFTNSFGNPDKAYHNSVAVRGATIYILGPTHLIVSRLLPWKERIQVLQRAGDWMGALAMSMRLHDGHAHGVVDLPRTVDAIRETIMPYLVELLLAYVDEVFSYISVAFCNQTEKNNKVDDRNARSNSVHAEMEQYARVGGVAVEFCLHIERTDILFDVIFSKFVSVQQGGAFLEILEPYILKDLLGSLPPEIMQSLVEHYSSKGWLQRVEQCVLHMDISSLDFNQVVRLCREHGLYGALIYLFNKGLDDYKTPLEELLMVVQNRHRKEAAVIGYRMLVYLKYCFLGLAFPPGHGSISLARLPSLRKELLHFLLEDSGTLDSEVIRTFRSSCEACLNLFYLLWFDLEATLEVLSCAFLSDAHIKSDNLSENMVDYNLEEKGEFSHANSANQIMVQSIVNTLILCFNMESNEIRFFKMDSGSLEVWPSEKDVRCVFEFIVFFVACKQATISGKVLKHILEYLSSHNHSTGDTSQKIEVCRKEKQLISLLKVVPEGEWNTSYVLDLCLRAQYYQACGVIYTIRSQYVDALDSYMKDLNEPAHAFAFIHKMLSQLEEVDHSSFRLAVISRLPGLVRVSREGTFFLVVDQFSEESQHILSYLQSDPQSLFLFLKATVDVHLKGKLDFSALKQCHPPLGRPNVNESNDLRVYLEELPKFPKLLSRNPIHVTDEIAELYLELLCQFERGSVLKFLETFENYRLEHCLRLCQDYGITDASSFLLERAGDVGGAFTIAVDSLREKFDRLASYVQNLIPKATIKSVIDVEHVNGIMQTNECLMVCEVLHALIGLCQRNTYRLDPQESESLWLRLLDTFCEPLRELSHDTEVSNGRGHSTTLHENFKTQNNRVFNESANILRRLFSQFIKEIVEGMIGYIPLPTIMAKLLGDNGNQEFGDFKFTILGMLGTFGFERRILDTAKLLIEDDTFYTMSLLKKGASHAYSPQSFVCCFCGCLLTKESSASGIRVYNCGHATHLHCESQVNEPSEKVGSLGCVVCLPKRKTPRPRNKSVLVDNGLIMNSTKSNLSIQGASNIHHLHEPEQMEKTYGHQQVSRFEILSNLQKSRGSLKFDGQPQLRLAPPAIYHEKVQKGAGVLLGESTVPSVKSERSNKSTHQTQTKQGGLSKRFPLKSSLFGSEKIRIPQLPSSRK